MKKIKILSILALLLMAATQGAWADTRTFSGLLNSTSKAGGYSYTNDPIKVTFNHSSQLSGYISRNDGVVSSSVTVSSLHGEIITGVQLTDCSNPAPSVYDWTVTIPASTGTGTSTYTLTGLSTTSVTIQTSGNMQFLQFTGMVVTYTIPTYAITYDGNGSTGGSTESQTKTHNVDLTLRSNGFTRDGFTFTGWNTLADGSGTPYAAEATYSANADLSLFAQWQAIFGVATDATMSDGWTIAPTNATAGETVTATYSGTRHVKSVKYLGVPTLTAAPTAIDGLTYDGTAQALVNAGTATNGTLQYKLGADGEYSTSIPTATDAGSYTVYYKVVGAAGFVDLDEASVEVEIAAAPVSYTAPTIVSSTLAYNGSGKALVTGGSATGGTIYYRYDYTPNIGSASSSEWSTTVPTPTNAGTYTVYYKVVAAEGYTGGVESTSLGSKVIGKANGWVSLTPSSGGGFSILYNGNYTVTVNSHGGSLSYSKSGQYADYVSVEVLSGTQVRIGKTNSLYPANGTTVTITSAPTNNYNQASANFSCIN